MAKCKNCECAARLDEFSLGRHCCVASARVKEQKQICSSRAPAVTSPFSCAHCSDFCVDQLCLFYTLYQWNYAVIMFLASFLHFKLSLWDSFMPLPVVVVGSYLWLYSIPSCDRPQCFYPFCYDGSLVGLLK